MQIIDSHNLISDIISDVDLVKHLETYDRSEKNHFWIANEVVNRFSITPPSLSISINKELAVLFYFGLSDQQYASSTDIINQDLEGFTCFLLEDNPQHPIPNYQVVRFTAAQRACVQFFQNSTFLPSAISWNEL